MKQLSKTSELLWVFGTIFVALGVSICSKSDLGVSMIAAPAFVMQEALCGLVPWLTVGVCEYIFQGIMLVVMCLCVRRFTWKYLLAFLCAVLYGYTLDLFILIFRDVVINTVLMQWITLIVGDVCTALGVACFFKTYLPLQVYELFVAEVASKFKFNINKVKSVFDISLLLISVAGALLLFGDVFSFDWTTIYKTSFHSIGLGTIMTTLINSPIIALWGRLIDKTCDTSARFPKLEKILKR